jgi:hypothetical protein
MATGVGNDALLLFRVALVKVVCVGKAHERPVNVRRARLAKSCGLVCDLARDDLTIGIGGR